MISIQNINIPMFFSLILHQYGILMYNPHVLGSIGIDTKYNKVRSCRPATSPSRVRVNYHNFGIELER